MIPTNEEKIQGQFLNYLILKRPETKKFITKSTITFTCPLCNNSLSGVIPPKTNQARCHSCHKVIGDIYSLVRLLEEDKKDFTDKEIDSYLNKLLNLNLLLEQELLPVLDFYEKNGFDLVPIARNQKIPIEKEWTIKTHKSKSEWLSWLNDKVNFGVKTGKCSGITILDIDQNGIPEEVLALLPENILRQKTGKGWHFFFKFNDSIPSTRIDEYKMDILNDGKQAVIFPSIVEGGGRVITLGDIIEIPEPLLKLLKSKITIKDLKSHSELLKDDIKTENFKINPEDLTLKNNNLDGCCNDTFIRLGGILLKQLSSSQVGFVLEVLNRHLLERPMGQTAIRGMINSLSKYYVFDERELALKILNYMKVVEEANSLDIMSALGEGNGAEIKQKVEKSIAYLVREGFLVKKKRIYKIIKKIEWQEKWYDDSKEIPFKMPYFYDIATFRSGDMIIIGGMQKVGKSHIAMNIISSLVDQGIKPYYISLESGSRFALISQQLSLKEGDYFYNKEPVAPETLELEDNAVTVLDWLLPTDYAETDKIFLHLSNQLKKHGGILVVFVQLKQDGKFFAENMISLFPALVSKYSYDSVEDGSTGKFTVDFMREPKGKRKRAVIPCEYNWDTKKLERVDEVQGQKPVSNVTITNVNIEDDLI